jgi:cellobiose phosphorylase
VTPPLRPPPPFGCLAGPVPAARFLSNGAITSVITAAGSGFVGAGSLLLTAWAGDRVEDRSGVFTFLREPAANEAWSTGVPLRPGPGDAGEAEWQPGRVAIRRWHGGLETRLEVAVAPRLPVEVRRLHVANRSDRSRVVEITTSAEVVLHDSVAHEAHPVFSKLFLQTEHDPQTRALLANRRPRGEDETFPVLFFAHPGAGAYEFESDRELYPGRSRLVGDPVPIPDAGRLTGSVGNVLDPALSFRRTVALDAGEESTLIFLLGVAPDHEEARRTIRDLSREKALDEIFLEVEARDRDFVRSAGADPAEDEALQALAGAALYGHPSLGASPETRARARHSSALSRELVPTGEDVLVLLRADRPGGEALVELLVRAQRIWSARKLPLKSLVVQASDVARDTSSLDGAMQTVAAGTLTPEELDFLEARAGVVIDGEWPDLSSCEDRSFADAPGALPWIPPRVVPLPEAPPYPSSGESLEFFNGFGGFAAEGHEYVMRLSRDGRGRVRRPPRPWINVLANEKLGCIVAETGAACTWSVNSREHRLTPWHNDPLLDGGGEALYVRDEESGEIWGPQPGPAVGSGDHEVRHGPGRSVFRVRESGIDHETVTFVASRDSVRITSVRLVNRTSRARRLSIVSFARWVLGSTPRMSGRNVITEIEASRRAIFARNLLADEMAERVAFAAVVAAPADSSVHFGGDRAAFLGPRGSLACPLALRSPGPVPELVGAGLDPCAIVQVEFRLEPNERAEVAFALGDAESAESADELLERWSRPGAVASGEQEAVEAWRELGAAVQIETSSPALDRLVNTWLPHQTLSCRIWGRTAFYQSGGAFGFRDQLQDATAFTHLLPRMARDQILLHAAHQFVEGDVLHWWHPPGEAGIRTRFSDDLLWLPFLTADYVAATGDRAILAEPAPFLSARSLEPGEQEAFVHPVPSGESADLYEHCVRALDRSLTQGAHGLPLIGSGDWNDGMNRVGRLGRGESVWLGFFLHRILEDFAPFVLERGDRERAAHYREYGSALRDALERAGWDGEWYRRGYYDDGTPLGTSQSEECRIDALVQAWSVFSGAVPRERSERALDAVEHLLISKRDRIIRLLTPPFENTPHDPGYIKGYVRGVRENGGQYTHAALWVVRALARLGRRDRVAALLDLLNPIHHARTPEEVAVYRVEPYVVAADVYGEPPHVGRGGWTWYTGSSGWMYRVALESLLGIRAVAGEAYEIRPCIPDEWPGYRVRLAPPGTRLRYDIRVTNPTGISESIVAAALDGDPLDVVNGAVRIPWARDDRAHRVEVRLGPAAGGGPR